MLGCQGSISSRLTSPEESSFFFEPVEFDLQLPDLLIQLGFQGILILADSGAALREDMRQFSQRLFLPLHHLIRMHPIVTGDFVDGPLPFDCLQGNSRLQLGALRLSLLWHQDHLMGQQRLYTLNTGPNFGVHHTLPKRL
jgi:hypothetical protein